MLGLMMWWDDCHDRCMLGLVNEHDRWMLGLGMIDAMFVGKSGFVSHIKHTAEATIMDLLHSWEITCNLEF